MHTSLDCIPCFFRQALAGARLAAPDDTELHELALRKWGGIVAELNLNTCPPEIARELYSMLASLTEQGDLFDNIKDRANRRVLELLPRVREMVQDVSDSLAAALEVSVIGNSIDCGVDIRLDWEKELFQTIREYPLTVPDEFRDALMPGAKVLVIGDNAGEIGLDIPLVEFIKNKGCDVTYGVRGIPVLNDATMDDAVAVGMDTLCNVVSSGVDAPGTVLNRCKPAFIDLMHNSDVIISKGQGNFEALWGEWPGIYFAFKVKCHVVAKLTGFAEGTSMFFRSDELSE